MTARGKILLAIVLSFIVVTVLTGLTMTLHIVDSIRSEHEQKSRFLTQLISDYVNFTMRGSYKEMNWSDFDKLMSSSALVSDWAICETGSLKGLSSSKQPAQLSEEDIADLRDAASRGSPVVRGNVVFSSIKTLYGETLLCRLTLTEKYATGIQFGNILFSTIAVLFIGAAVTGLIVYVMLDKFLIRPMEELSAGARRVAAGNYMMPVQGNFGSLELESLVSTFNMMMNRLDEAEKSTRMRMQSTEKALKETQRSLVVAQRLSATGTLAAGIAHEINNPLSGMLNAAMVMDSDQLPAEKQKEYIGIIIGGLERIREIVTRLLMMSPKPTQRKENSVKTIVEQVKTLLEYKIRKKGAQFVVNVPDNSMFMCDAVEIQQVILNLALNALDAIPDGGTISLSVTDTESTLDIIVSDNGCGMDDEVMNQCFNPFFSTKHETGGTGLGLAVAKSIVESYRGDIIIESRKGEGTTVKVIIPKVYAQK